MELCRKPRFPRRHQLLAERQERRHRVWRSLQVLLIIIIIIFFFFFIIIESTVVFVARGEKDATKGEKGGREIIILLLVILIIVLFIFFFFHSHALCSRSAAGATGEAEGAERACTSEREVEARQGSREGERRGR